MWNNALIILCTALLSASSLIKAREIQKEKMGPKNFVMASGRIVNGTEAYRGQFPHQVSLRVRWSESHFCGGVIITPNWVLTAAHCVRFYGEDVDPHWIIIVAGEIYLKYISYCHQSRSLSEIIVHGDFDEYTLDNDIALLKLETELKFDPYVKPASLRVDAAEAPNVCKVSGWGAQKEGGEVSYRLLYADLQLVKSDACESQLGDRITENMICAGWEQGGKGACQGDSGGGLLCDYLLTGITSWGRGCARMGKPSVYTKVVKYQRWIEERVHADPWRKYPISSTPLKDSASSKLKSNLSFALLICVLAAPIKL